MVLTDDMREDDLAYAPYLRRFFAEGLHFRNSFSNNPMCCPARASILTGQQSHNHHVVTVEPPWGFGAFDDSVTVATALKAAGYQTGYVGKYLNGYGIQRSKVTGQDSSRYVPAGLGPLGGAASTTTAPASRAAPTSTSTPPSTSTAGSCATRASTRRT